MSQTYIRRIPPSDYQQAWVSLELSNIERAIGPDGVTAGSYGDASHFPKITVDASGRVTDVTLVPIVAGGPTTAMRSSNLTQTGFSPLSVGLSLSVAIGESWACRWVLYLNRTAGTVSAAVSTSLAFPAITSGHVAAVGVTAGLTTLRQEDVSLTSSPTFIGTAWSNFVGLSSIKIDTTVQNVTAAGTVDLRIQSGAGGDSVVILAGSCLIATKL